MSKSPDSMPSSKRLILTSAEIKFYQNEGYLYLGGLVDSEAVQSLREEVLAVVEAHFGINQFELSRARESADRLRQSGQYLKGSRLDGLINGDAVKSVASQLIQGAAHVYFPFTAIKAGGGGGEFNFHQDNNYTQHEPALGSINIWVALVDMTPANGCLQIVPRSHLNGQLDSYDGQDKHAGQQLNVDPVDCLPIRMRAGDAVAFTRWTVHGSGPNNTDCPRVAYALQYHREDVKWRKPDTGELTLLVDSPRFNTRPVDKIIPQA